MKCPFCQGVIDDDSRYCDLCGKHLMFCPECRQPKKGTSCPRCGELLISAEEFFGAKVAVNSKPSDSPKPMDTAARQDSPKPLEKIDFNQIFDALLTLKGKI